MQTLNINLTDNLSLSNNITNIKIIGSTLFIQSTNQISYLCACNVSKYLINKGHKQIKSINFNELITW